MKRQQLQQKLYKTFIGFEQLSLLTKRVYTISKIAATSFTSSPKSSGVTIPKTATIAINVERKEGSSILRLQSNFKNNVSVANTTR